MTYNIKVHNCTFKRRIFFFSPFSSNHHYAWKEKEVGGWVRGSPVVLRGDSNFITALILVLPLNLERCWILDWVNAQSEDWDPGALSWSWWKCAKHFISIC